MSYMTMRKITDFLLIFFVLIGCGTACFAEEISSTQNAVSPLNTFNLSSNTTTTSLYTASFTRTLFGSVYASVQYSDNLEGNTTSSGSPNSGPKSVSLSNQASQASNKSNQKGHQPRERATLRSRVRSPGGGNPGGPQNGARHGDRPVGSPLLNDTASSYDTKNIMSGTLGLGLYSDSNSDVYGSLTYGRTRYVDNHDLFSTVAAFSATRYWGSWDFYVGLIQYLGYRYANVIDTADATAPESYAFAGVDYQLLSYLRLSGYYYQSYASGGASLTLPILGSTFSASIWTPNSVTLSLQTKF